MFDAACRNGFPDVVKILDQIVDNMLKLPPGEELDINNVTLRFAVDVTGKKGISVSASLSPIRSCCCSILMDAGAYVQEDSRAWCNPAKTMFILVR